MPVFDTNNNPAQSEAFIGKLTSVLKSYDGHPIDGLEAALSEKLLPGTYKFTIPVATANVKLMTGYLSPDWDGIRPVMFDDEEDDASLANRDLTEVYMAKDDTDTYLYIAIKLRGAPYTAPFVTGEWLNYHIGFNARGDDRGSSSVPVTIELQGYPGVWAWHLWSYGADKGSITDTRFEYAMGDIVEFKIPLDYLIDTINTYEPNEHFPGGVWDGKEIYVSASFWSHISSKFYGDSTHCGKLAKLK